MSDFEDFIDIENVSGDTLDLDVSGALFAEDEEMVSTFFTESIQTCVCDASEPGRLAGSTRHVV